MGLFGWAKQVFEELKSYDDTSQWRTGMIAPALPAAKQSDQASLKFCSSHNISIAEPVDFWTEAALFSQAGFPAIVLGPGDIKQAHTIDEWVYVSELEKTYHLYKKVIES